jgi:hypothetical protein
MLVRRLLPLLMTGSAALLVGCQGSSPAEKRMTTKSETSQTTDAGTSSSKSETTQVGSTVETKTEFKTDTPEGSHKVTRDIVVGTVTAFSPGKSIEVMTGNKKSHSFDLGGKDLLVNIDTGTTVGSKVELVEEKGDKGYRKITVTRSR